MNRRSFLAILGSALAVDRGNSSLLAMAERPTLHPGDLVPVSVTAQLDTWLPYMIFDQVVLAPGRVNEILFPPPQPEEFMVSAFSVACGCQPDGLLLDMRVGEQPVAMPVPLGLLVCGNMPFQMYPPLAFNARNPLSMTLRGTASSPITIEFGLHGAIKATPEQAARWAESWQERELENDEWNEEQEDKEG